MVVPLPRIPSACEDNDAIDDAIRRRPLPRVTPARRDLRRIQMIHRQISRNPNIALRRPEWRRESDTTVGDDDGVTRGSGFALPDSAYKNPAMAEKKTKGARKKKVKKATGRTAFIPAAGAVRTALESGKVGVFVWNINENTTDWSTNLEEIHGLASGSFDGSFNFFQNDVHPEDRDAVMSAIQRALQEAGPFQVRYRLPPKDGVEDRWIEAKGGVEAKRGAPVRMHGVCQDVTDRVRLELELLSRARQQELVARLGSEALTESDLGVFLNKAAQRVAQELSVDFVKILELLPGDREFLLRAGTGWKHGLVGKTHLPADLQSQEGYTLSNGKPVIVDDLRIDTRFTGPALLHDHGVVSGVTVLILGRDGRPYGIIGAHTSKLRRFGERDVAFLGAVANVIAGAIEQRLSDSRQNLLIRELRHRSGNLFSQLLALFSQSARTSSSIHELSSKFEARVMALANAHKLITEGGWQCTGPSVAAFHATWPVFASSPYSD
jgi:PAS domain S-box-containing protein